MGRLFVIVGGLIVLALTAALVVPYFVDWTSYRSAFEKEAGAILGRPVTVRGDATVRLLPFPSVTFSDVLVGDENGRDVMTVETFSMDAELPPLLRGEFLIYDMRMVRPRATIEVAADGTVDWAVRPAATFDPGRITVENLTITEGRIELRHALSGRTHLVSEINADLSARALDGPWRMEGTMRLDGARAKLSASTGRPEPDGRLRLKVRLAPALSPFVVESEGAVAMTDGRLGYDGRFRLFDVPAATSDESRERNAAAPLPTAASAYRITGDFDLDQRRLALEDVRLETGPVADPYTADGKATVEFGAEPRFSIVADGAQIRLDQSVSGDANAALGLDQRLAAIRAALVSLPQPSIPGSVEVRLPAVVVGDTMIRDVRLSAEPGLGGWTLNSAAATLPGRTTLEAEGFLFTGEDMRFSGSLLLAIAQPSGFAAWVSEDIDDAIRRLPAAGFSAKVDLSRARQSFTDLELGLGTATFRGTIERTGEGMARPSLRLKLAGDALDVDGLAAFSALFVSDAGASRFADTDLDLDLRAGPVTAGGVTAETMDVALRLRGGDLEIDRFAIGGLGEATLSATGQIKGFPANPAGKVDASIVAVDLAPTMRLAARRFPAIAWLQKLAARAEVTPGLLADSKIDFVASAAPNADGTTGFALSLQGTTGGSALSASLSGSGRPEAPLASNLTASIVARNGDASALLALAGLPALPLGLTGPGEVDLSAKGVPADGLATTASLDGDRFRAAFSGTTRIGESFSASGKVTITAADIEPWLMTVALAVPGMGLGTSADLSADLELGDGRLGIRNLDGVFEEDAVSGSLIADLSATVPHLQGALSLDAVDIGLFAAILLGEDALAPAADATAWQAAPFRADPSPFVTADLALTAAVLGAGSGPALSDATLALKLDADGLRIANLRGRLYGGDATGFFELRNNSGAGLASGQFQIKGADLALALPDAGLEGRADVSANLSTSGNSLEAFAGTLGGSGTATLTDITVSGLNAGALPALLAKADEAGQQVDALLVAAFAPPIVSTGSFSAKGADIAFTIANGVLRAPSVRLQDPLATLSADLRAEIPAGQVVLDGTLEFQPGAEQVAGAEPVVAFSLEGPLAALTRRLDTGPLAQFLSQRSLEREQARVEAMQAVLVEKQRLRREARYYAALQTERDRLAEEARRTEEEARRKVEAEEKRKTQAAEAARRAAEEKKRAADAAAATQSAPAPRPDRVVRDPVPPADVGTQDDTEIKRRRLEPFSIDNFLKTLQGQD